MVTRLFLLFFCCIVLFVFGLFIAPLAFGELNMSGETGTYVTLSRVPGEAWSFTGSAFGRLTASPEGSDSVKSELSLDVYTFSVPYIDIYRAYVKVRFPVFRATMGKTRLSWGEGSYFNAGDILFGSLEVEPDLTSEAFRTTGRWLAAVTLPTGRFSLFEGAVLPPVPAAGTPNGSGIDLPRISETTLGLRYVTKVGTVKLEAGYGYRGSDDLHESYVGIQGNLVADYHVTAAASIPAAEPGWEDVADRMRISWGLFYLVPGLRESTFSFRLEGLVRPKGSWNAVSHTVADAEPYGILLYPEIMFSPVRSLSLLLRSVVSPLDGSALSTGGLDWNVYQGFHILTFTAVQSGGRENLFSWEKPGSLAFTLGFRSTF